MSNPDLHPAIARLLLAACELAKAQRELERAQKRFDAAYADAEVNAVEPAVAAGERKP